MNISISILHFFSDPGGPIITYKAGIAIRSYSYRSSVETYMNDRAHLRVGCKERNVLKIRHAGLSSATLLLAGVAIPA
jgi:hypothetical protein